jgi:hypothetical protein
VKLELFRALTEQEEAAVRDAARRYARFLGRSLLL